MVKAKEWSQKFREEIVALYKKGKWYKKISMLLNVPRDNVGSIILKVQSHWYCGYKMWSGTKEEAYSCHSKIREKTGGQEP